MLLAKASHIAKTDNHWAGSKFFWKKGIFFLMGQVEKDREYFEHLVQSITVAQ